jgi:plastocyanin
VGDVITFKNEDEFAHNVFSLSEVQSFDLGSYKKGESRALTLTSPGTIEVECAIHPEMRMKIEVSK